MLAKDQRGYEGEKLFQWKDLDPALTDEAVNLLHSTDSTVPAEHIQHLLER